jgi:hypothetical protein
MGMDHVPKIRGKTLTYLSYFYLLFSNLDNTWTNICNEIGAKIKYVCFTLQTDRNFVTYCVFIFDFPGAFYKSKRQHERSYYDNKRERGPKGQFI